MEDEQIHRFHPERTQARINLGGHRLVQVIDLVDEEHPVAPSLERCADNLLAVPVLVARGGIHEVQPEIQRPPQGRHACLQRNRSIRQIADAEN